MQAVGLGHESAPTRLNPLIQRYDPRAETRPQLKIIATSDAVTPQVLLSRDGQTSLEGLHIAGSLYDAVGLVQHFRLRRAGEGVPLCIYTAHFAVTNDPDGEAERIAKEYEKIFSAPVEHLSGAVTIVDNTHLFTPPEVRVQFCGRQNVLFGPWQTERIAHQVRRLGISTVENIEVEERRRVFFFPSERYAIEMMNQYKQGNYYAIVVLEPQEVQAVLQRRAA